jgi:Homeodomain
MEPAFSSWPTDSQTDSPKERPKKPRHRHSTFQLAALNELYERNEHPSLDDRTSLAEKLEMCALPSTPLPLSHHSLG